MTKMLLDNGHMFLGYFFQADFESGNYFSLSGLVLAVQNTSIFIKFRNIALLERLQF